MTTVQKLVPLLGLSLSLMGGVASAQTLYTGTSTTDVLGATTTTTQQGTPGDNAQDTTSGTAGTLDTTSTTPGVPNTGEGGAAPINVALLGVSAAAALASAAYLLSTRRSA